VEETADGKETIPGNSISHWMVVEVRIAAPVVVEVWQPVDPHQNHEPKKRPYVILCNVSPFTIHSITQHLMSIDIGLLYDGGN